MLRGIQICANFDIVQNVYKMDYLEVHLVQNVYRMDYLAIHLVQNVYRMDYLEVLRCNFGQNSTSKQFRAQICMQICAPNFIIFQNVYKMDYPAVFCICK